MVVKAAEAITIALECLEVGDVAGAVDALLEGQDGDAPAGFPYRCECGRQFRWLGELDGHVRRYAHSEVHDELLDAAA